MTRDIIKDPNAEPPCERDLVERLYYEEMCSMREIGERVGTSRQCLARWMEFWGMQRRTGREGLRVHNKKNKIERGPNWKGGEWYAPSQDTWWTYAPEHPRARHNGAVPTHVLVAEEALGRYVEEGEHVHHLDENRSNNTVDNVCVLSAGDHQYLHRLLGNVGIQLIDGGYEDLVLRTLDGHDLHFVHDVYIKKMPQVSHQGR